MSNAKQKTIWSYAVMRSGFGDLWIGKTKLKPNGKSIFASFDGAKERAEQLNDSIENAEELDDMTEEDIKPLGENMEKWIIK